MELQDLLDKAESKQVIIQPKRFGLGGHRGMRYFFLNGTSIETGEGRKYVNYRGVTGKKLDGRDYSFVSVTRGKEKWSFRGKMDDVTLEIIENILNQAP